MGSGADRRCHGGAGRARATHRGASTARLFAPERPLPEPSRRTDGDATALRAAEAERAGLRPADADRVALHDASRCDRAAGHQDRGGDQDEICTLL
ncbi:hypothetical protein SAMN04487982_104259 [Streptomyces sp. ok210]|jgi:hypothetical protein|nr:hypothetical protein SAMN04487982_104259 [Streptomyces sp. ok210]